MCDKLLEKMEENASLRNMLWTSDEAHFHLEGKVNVFWGSEKPTEAAQTPLHAAKCTVFWGSEKPTEAPQIPLHAAKCTVFWGTEKPLRLPRHPYIQPNALCSGEVRSH